MTSSTRTTLARLADLDVAMDARGIDADPVTLLMLAHEARDLGVNEVLVSVMVDEAEPAVARLRAYARVAVQVATRVEQVDVTASARELQPAC